MRDVDFRLVPAGDALILVEFDERIDPAVSARVVAMAADLRRTPVAGIRDLVPAYRSLGVAFDPLTTRVEKLCERLTALAASHRVAAPAAGSTIDIPVRYGGEAGPDLDAVADFARLAPADVIAIHTATTYRVYMLGFMPGFAYLGVVDPRIAMPRRGSPRLAVPKGSVGIAGPQTGIYPAETPGGWQIIGQTAVHPFDAARPDPFLFKAGDMVRFHPVAP